MFDPDVFDRLLELRHALSRTVSSTFSHPFQRCNSMLSGRFRPSPAAGTDMDAMLMATADMLLAAG